jgi:hypothetical protein
MDEISVIYLKGVAKSMNSMKIFGKTWDKYRKNPQKNSR